MQQNEKVKKHLILWFAINLALVLIITVVSLFSIYAIKSKFDSYHIKLKDSLVHTEMVRKLYDIDIELFNLAKIIRQHILANTNKERLSLEQELLSSKEHLYKQLEVYKDLNKKSTNPYDIIIFEKKLNELEKSYNEILKFSSKEDDVNALVYLRSVSNKRYYDVDNIVTGLINKNVRKSILEQKKSQNFYEDNKKIIAIITPVLTLLGLFSIALSLILGIFTIKLVASKYYILASKEKELNDFNFKLKKLYKKEMIIKQITNAIRESLDLQDVLNAIVKETGSYIDVQMCLILEPTELKDQFKLLKYKYSSSEEFAEYNNEYLRYFNSISNELLNIEDISSLQTLIESNSNYNPNNETEPFLNKTIIFAPIKYQTNILAIIVLIDNKDRVWQDYEKEMIITVTNQAAIAIEQSLLFEELKEVNNLLLMKEKQLTEQNKRLEYKRELLRSKNEELTKTTQALENANHELLAINRSLIELNTLKSSFVSTVSHELRTPLTSIKGSLGLILNGMIGDINEETKTFLHICYKNTDRLIRLISDLLDISKIESGKIDLKKTTFDLSSLVLETIEGISGYAINNNVNIYNKIDDQIYIFGDYDKISQVMYNLLSNSIKFSNNNSSKQPTIEVFATSDNDYTTIKVIDNGIGIPYEKQSSIFEKFSQADNSDKRTNEGTGLGLSICKAIIEMHNGNISFISKENEGVSMSFTIASKEIQLNSNYTD